MRLSDFANSLRNESGHTPPNVKRLWKASKRKTIDPQSDISKAIEYGDYELAESLLRGYGES